MKNYFIDYLANPHYIYPHPPSTVTPPLNPTPSLQHPVTPLPSPLSPLPSPHTLTPFYHWQQHETCIFRVNIRSLINNLAVSLDVRHAFNFFSM